MSTPAIDAGRPLDDSTVAQLGLLGPADDTPVADAKPAKPRRSRSRTKPAAAAADKPAAAPRSRSGTRSRKPAVNIKAGLTQLYTMAGMGASMAPSPAAKATGVALVENAESCAAAWEQAAKENPRIKAALEQLLTVSTVGVVVAAHLPIVLAGLAAGGKLEGIGVGAAALIPEQPAAPPADQL